jgi:hypothetical protein
MCDPDIGAVANLGTQCVQAGVPKVQSVIAACEAIRPDSAAGQIADVRHVGIGVIKRCHLLADCTDDPGLAIPLTEISNGLGLPLLRLALDGSGVREFGRVLCSDGGNGRSCQLCNYSLDDLTRILPRTPCPGRPLSEGPPTLAGGAVGMSIAGLGLLQAQRIGTGNDAELVWDCEVAVDWSSLEAFAIQLVRSPGCLSGHQRWELIEIPEAQITAFRDVYAAAGEHMTKGDFSLEAFQHPLCLQATCDCGALAAAVGTVWSIPPVCSHCGRAMHWRTETALRGVNRRLANELDLLDRRPAELGFPEAGAMFIARRDGEPPVRIVLC